MIAFWSYLKINLNYLEKYDIKLFKEINEFKNNTQKLVASDYYKNIYFNHNQLEIFQNIPFFQNKLSYNRKQFLQNRLTNSLKWINHNYNFDTNSNRTYIANLYLKLNNYLKAIEIFEEILNIDRKEKSEIDNFVIGIDINNIALAYALNGNLNKSIELLNEALQISLKTLGKEHKTTLCINKNLRTCENELASKWGINSTRKIII
jgi:tetratricopeptide (TPR) repeat protein